MTATTFDALVTQAKGNVLKALNGGVLIAPISAALPASLTALSTGDSPAPVLQSLTGFSSLGLLTDDGAVLSQDVSSSAIQAWGQAYPVRTDVTSKTTTLKITGLESSKAVLATYFGVDPSTITPDADTGEVILTDVGDLSTTYYRVLVLSQDGAAGSEKWVATLLPNANITDYGDMTFMSGDTSIQYDMTFTAYKDDTAGFAKKTFYAGPGWLAGADAAGFGS
jgi:hypothetical protein